MCVYVCMHACVCVCVWRERERKRQINENQHDAYSIYFKILLLTVAKWFVVELSYLEKGAGHIWDMAVGQLLKETNTGTNWI